MSILVSVMITLFAVSLVELLPELLRFIHDLKIRSEFKSFFGAAAFKDDVRLVHAHRTLDQACNPYPMTTYCKRAPTDARPEGTDAWLAFQDLRAAAYLATSIHGMTGRDKVEFTHDRDINTGDFGYCAISIGLGFNEFTHYLSGLCGNLFKIEWGYSPKNNKLKTDYFTINGRTPPKLPKKDHAIIARIVSQSASGPRVSFVCAGRTAAGTAAAGFFLAKKWKRLLALYKDKNLNLDSMAVAIVHTADDTGVGVQHYDFSGEIVNDLITWGKASGMD